METDLADRKLAVARAMCSRNKDRNQNIDCFLTANIQRAVRIHQERRPILDVLSFVNKLGAEIEMEYAGQLGWVPHASHGFINKGLLHKGQHGL